MTSAPTPRTDTPDPAPGGLTVNYAAILALTVLVLFYAYLVFGMVLLLPDVGSGGILVDFDAFMISGGLFNAGDIMTPYDNDMMRQIQTEIMGAERGFMPWTYPPQFDLIAMVLATMPRWLAYSLFTATTLIAYLAVLWALAGWRMVAILIALLPAFFISLSIGQNSLLTGALAGLFCLLTLRRSKNSGWPLGLMVIKPHLALGLGIHAMASRDLRAMVIAAVVVIGSSLLATAVLGVGIWDAFLQGVQQASAALANDFYPQFRMMSVYVALETVGVPASIALGAQSVVAIAACVTIASTVLRGLPLHHTLAIACFASPLFSPYVYDYDMIIVGIGLALVSGDLLARARWLELAILFVLFWVTGLYGYISGISLAELTGDARIDAMAEKVAYGGWGYLATAVTIWAILRRPEPAAGG
ncbi:MAG: glycosyltransferase family 87 protein [Paracoccaceae bacterium]